MKKKYSVLLFFCLFICYIGLQSSSNGRATANNTGSTGAPMEGTCTGCHNSNAFGTVSVSIGVFDLGTSNSIASYVPGTTYDVKVAISNTLGTPAGWGFQMTTLTTPGYAPLAGYSNLAANVKQKTLTTGTFAGRTYTEHKGVSTSNQFAFQWTAPATGTGSVKMYAAGNAVNHNGNSTGDKGANTSVTITEALPISVSAVVTDVSCNGAGNGAITLTVSGGTTPYYFSWNDGITTQNRAALPAGSYSLTVSDALSTTASYSYTVNEPDPLNITVVKVTDANTGNDGSIDIGVNGGEPNYTFTWSNGVSTEDNLQLGEGSYSVTVTDANNCMATQENIAVQITDGIKTPESIDARLYSNPAENMLTIEVQSPGVHEVTIYNSNGLAVMRQSLSNAGNGKYALDISSLPPSLYIIALNTGERRWVSRFVKL